LRNERVEHPDKIGKVVPVRSGSTALKLFLRNERVEHPDKIGKVVSSILINSSGW